VTLFVHAAGDADSRLGASLRAALGDDVRSSQSGEASPVVLVRRAQRPV